MKNTYVWSAKNISFFPVSNISDYKKTDWDVSDAINVGDEIFDTYTNVPPIGKMLGVDSVGMPAWVDIPPLSKDEYIKAANNEKDFRINNARAHISLWQTQLQLGMISDTDKAKLIEWMHYITALQAVDTSTAPDINWPQQPAE
ncbi:tail fiber assembly protein [Plesiomonas shigelloides]|uniref:tail fiber assembly protein n=1 Tax=Plesiomonas shigelloides TaxID=703 RepID=UPI00057A6C69|nr:tail fiber assembly protein [Plesiomonas shigelloides]